MLAVVATAAIAQGDPYSRSARHPSQSMAGQYEPEHFNPERPVPSRGNPWALPQPLVSPSEFQAPQKYYGEPGSADTVTSGRTRSQRGQFVTPEFLESLKQQQKQYQLMPGRQQDRSGSSRYVPVQPLTGLPGQGGMGQPLVGMGYSDPLYDAPAVSPWGDGSDVLYRGESFPLVPDEAIGGIAPMPMPVFGFNNSENDGSIETPLKDENKVFNPFTFLPNSGLRRP